MKLTYPRGLNQAFFIIPEYARIQKTWVAFFEYGFKLSTGENGYLKFKKSVRNKKINTFYVMPESYASSLCTAYHHQLKKIDETIAIAALFQAICAKIYKLRVQNMNFIQYSRHLINENKWRASR